MKGKTNRDRNMKRNKNGGEERRGEEKRGEERGEKEGDG